MSNSISPFNQQFHGFLPRLDPRVRLPALLALCFFSFLYASDQRSWDCHETFPGGYDIYVCTENCRRTRIRSIKDVRKTGFTSPCRFMKIPVKSKVFVRQSVPYPAGNKCPAEPPGFKIESKNDCWEAPYKKTESACQDIGRLEPFIRKTVIRENSACSYIFAFSFKQPGKYRIGPKTLNTLLVQDSIININNSGHNFSVIYLHKNDDLYLGFKPSQLRKVDLYNLSGNVLLSKDLEDYPKTVFKINMNEISGRTFLLTLKTEMRKLHKFIILE